LFIRATIVHGSLGGRDDSDPAATWRNPAYVTAQGEARAVSIDGTAAPIDVLSRTTQKIGVTVGGVPALIRFSGLAPGFSGLYQINFDVPKTAPLGNQVEVQVMAPLYASNIAKVAVR
jgi:uncharacterized protein (TIGR03437 family)